MSWEAPPPRRARRRRWTLPAALVIATAVGVAGIMALTRDGEPSSLTIGPTDPPADAIADTTVDTADFAQRRLPPVDVTSERPGTGPLLPGAGADLTLIAADGRGLQLVDLATGEVRRIEIVGPSPATLSDTVFTVDDWIIVDAEAEVIGLPPATPRPTRVAANHRAITTIDDDSIWVMDTFSSFASGTATRIGLDGTVQDRVGLAAVAEPLIGTADRLIIAAPGVIVSVGSDGRRRLIARGTALATDGERLSWLECTDDISCAITIGTLDDPAQVRRTLDPALLPAGYFGLFGLPLGRFSPDGRWLALPLYGSRSGRPEGVAVTVIDTSTGAEVFRADGSSVTSFATPLAWTPDSRWLLFVSGNTIRAWPAGEPRARRLDVGLRAVRALAVR